MNKYGDTGVPKFQMFGRKRILWFFAAVEVVAVVIAVVVNTDPRQFAPHFIGFTLLLQSAAVSAVVVYLGWRYCRFVLRRRMARFIALVAVAVGAVATYAGVLAVYGPQLPGLAGELSVVLQIANVLPVVAVVLYLVGRHRLRFDSTAHRDDVRKYLLHQRLRDHFLFNALNTTVYLIRPHPRKAVRILNDLCELFRVMLRQEATTTLAEEVEFVKRYIAIEHMRLGERLSIEWRVPDACDMQVSMPAMVLQPLVENAIYHGIETRADGGIVRITIEIAQQRVFFDVRNPVSGGQSIIHADGNRMAQESVRDRLFQTYGTACHFQCEQRHGEYRVAFSIPREKSDEYIDRR